MSSPGACRVACVAHVEELHQVVQGSEQVAHGRDALDHRGHCPRG